MGKKSLFVVGSFFVFLFHFFVSTNVIALFSALAAIFLTKVFFDLVKRSSKVYQNSPPRRTYLKLLLQELEKISPENSSPEEDLLSQPKKGRSPAERAAPILEVELQTDSKKKARHEIPDFDRLFKQKEI